MGRGFAHFLFFCTLAMAIDVGADDGCERKIVARHLQSSVDIELSRLKAFISEQIEKGRLRVDQVKTILNGRILGATSSEEILTERILFLLLERQSVDKIQLREWLARKEAELNERAVDRDHVSRSVVPMTRMRFHALKLKGARPFALMETAVTRVMWWTVMGRVPLGHSAFVPDGQPLTFVTTADMEVFVATLQARADRGDPVALELLVDHQHGDVYGILGYREFCALRDELLRVAKDLLVGPKTIMDGAEQLIQYAWLNLEVADDSEPMLVAEKTPFIIQGRNFFDLLGNTTEAVKRFRRPHYHYSYWGGSRDDGVIKFFVERRHGRGVPTALQTAGWLSELRVDGWTSFRLMRRRK